MKRFFLTLLAIILIAGVLAGVGFAGYRFGFQQGAGAASNGEIAIMPFARGNDFGWNRMPMHDFGPGTPRNFERGWGPGNFGMTLAPGASAGVPRGGGFGFFPFFGLLVQLAILGFIVWLVYKLFTGWRVTLTRNTPESPRVEPAQTVESESRTE